MRCYECGVDYNQIINGNLRMENSILGSYEIDNVDYRECHQCGEKLFPSATIKKIETKENELREGFLRKLAITDYVRATTAAGMIGISRQAIHKHPKIRRGFIFQIKHEGCWWYLKRSVEKYIETGDGRFALYKLSVNAQVSVRKVVGRSMTTATAEKATSPRLDELTKQFHPQKHETAYRRQQGSKRLISLVVTDEDSLNSGIGDDYATAAYSA